MSPPADLSAARVAFVGAGKMGGALLSGLSGAARPKSLLVIEPHPAPCIEVLCQAQGWTLSAAAPQKGDRFDAVVLAIKPQMLEAAAASIAPLLDEATLVVSILAGKRIADLSARLPARSFVRAMPNTPASIGRGVTGAYANDATTAEQRALAHALLAAAGGVEWVEREELIDAVTAVSGSGPAYVFYLAECLAEAGAAAGLPPDLAARLARATVSGAGELLHLSQEVSAATLRENVTSPGGTTAAALAVLMAEDGMRPLLEKAVAAAKRRAGELAG